VAHARAEGEEAVRRARTEAEEDLRRAREEAEEETRRAREEAEEETRRARAEHAAALEGARAAAAREARAMVGPPPPPFPRTNRTSLIPPLVLSGHVASLTPYRWARGVQRHPARRRSASARAARAGRLRGSAGARPAPPPPVAASAAPPAAAWTLQPPFPLTFNYVIKFDI